MSPNNVPKSHRTPSSATIKELYANAYRCAYPRCPRPLYKVDDDSGVRTLNSTASHICARREGGPRWDESQREEENRSANNLLALCLEHSKEIDDPKQVDKYPKDLLLKWRQQQLADFDNLGKQGWSIQNDDIESIIRHFDNVETEIRNSVVVIGGEGGSSTGAGGGGGGVLGSVNSRGGDGGTGGNTIVLKGKDATAPGAGGGGGGALGDGAIGGDGGNGGETIFAKIDAESLDSLLVRVGRGGESGKDGESTSIKLVKGGKVVETIEVKGGRAGDSGQPGDLSRFARPLTNDEFDSGAGMPAILLADYCRERNGLVTLVDAGWTKFSVPNLPFRAVWPTFLVFSLFGLKKDSVVDCSVTILGPDGDLVVDENCWFSNIGTEDFRVSLTLSLFLEIAKVGVFTVNVKSGDIVLAKLPIAVSCAA